MLALLLLLILSVTYQTNWSLYKPSLVNLVLAAKISLPNCTVYDSFIQRYCLFGLFFWTAKNLFCNDNNISPDFIHIDVEGAEYNVFMKLGEHRPKGIWVEMVGYRYYQNGRSDRSEIEDIDSELDDLLKSYGYYAAFQSNDDWLYLHKDAELKNKNYKN